MICKNCGEEILDNSIFCKNCGIKVKTELVCKRCGETIGDESIFCPYCGCPVAELENKKDTEEPKVKQDEEKDNCEEKISCIYCDNICSSNSMFCNKCGNLISSSLFCPVCNCELPFDAKICNKCGANIQVYQENVLDKMSDNFLGGGQYYSKFKMVKIEGGTVDFKGRTINVKPFYMSSTFISYGLYKEITENSPQEVDTLNGKKKVSLLNQFAPKDYANSTYTINRNEAIHFCDCLKKIDKTHNFRLPSLDEYIYFMQAYRHSSYEELKLIRDGGEIWLSDTQRCKTCGAKLRVCYSD